VEVRSPVSRSELIASLRSLAGRASGAHGAQQTALAREFETRKAQVLDRRLWKDGETIAALAAVAAELEDFDQAITLYRQALGVAKALAPLRSVEQLANILGRQAPRLAVAKGSGAAAEAIKLFEEARDWLDWLNRKLEPTGERLALRGSLHKRWALLTAGPERRRQLRQAMKAYGEARLLSGDQSYQVLNWIAIRFLLRAPKSAEVLQLARGEYARARSKESDAVEPSFWDRVAVPDALLHVALFEGSLAEPAPTSEILREYDRALATGPSARERASARDHLQFLSEMLGDATYQRSNAPAAALQPFIKKLT
jgi:tetratricopeptide (TPR) repeat protein